MTDPMITAANTLEASPKPSHGPYKASERYLDDEDVQTVDECLGRFDLETVVVGFHRRIGVFASPRNPPYSPKKEVLRGMSTCLRGREVRIQLRKRSGKREAKLVSVVIPNRWRKSDLLQYVRQEHPNESVKIVEWEILDWDQRLWMANPEGFSNYLHARI